MKKLEEPNPKYANCRGAKLIEVIAVEVNEGVGIADDPICRVLYLYTKEGKLLSRTGDDFNRLYCENDFMILPNNLPLL